MALLQRAFSAFANTALLQGFNSWHEYTLERYALLDKAAYGLGALLTTADALVARLGQVAATIAPRFPATPYRLAARYAAATHAVVGGSILTFVERAGAGADLTTEDGLMLRIGIGGERRGGGRSKLLTL